MQKPKIAGFTIVELLIVIVVIAILATITIVAYNGTTQNANQASARSAANQAYQKVLAYMVQNVDQVPTTLALAGVPNASSTTYQYTAGTNTFCITATTANQSFYINNTTQNVAMAGGCPGHSQGGVASITNYYVDPKPAQLPYTPAAWDGGNTMSTVATAATWTNSLRVIRVTYSNVTSSNNGGPTLALSDSYLPTAGQKFSLATSVKLIAGTGGIGSISADTNGAGTATTWTTSPATPTLSVGSITRLYATFTLDTTAAASSNFPRIYIQITNKTSGTIVEYGDIDLYAGDYQAGRNWYSGDSTNWIWNGTSDNSSSTGQAL